MSKKWKVKPYSFVMTKIANVMLRTGNFGFKIEVSMITYVKHDYLIGIKLSSFVIQTV